MLQEVTVILALAASFAQKAGPCDLMDRATVVALLGQSSTGGIPSGPERDEDTGGTLSYCTFRAGASAVILSQVTFSSAAEAGKATTQELVLSRMEGEGSKIVDELPNPPASYRKALRDATAAALLKL